MEQAVFQLKATVGPFLSKGGDLGGLQKNNYSTVNGAPSPHYAVGPHPLPREGGKGKVGRAKTCELSCMLGINIYMY